MTRSTLVVALALLAGPASAQQQPPPPQAAQPLAARGPRTGLGMGMRIQGGVYAPRVLVDRREALGLTPEQVTRLEALAQEAKQAADKADAEAKTHWDQLAELWKQPTPDVNQVRTHAQAALQAMQGARVGQLVAAAQAKAALTPEQRGRVAGWADARGPRMERGMDRMGRTGRGMGRMPMRMRRGPGPE